MESSNSRDIFDICSAEAANSVDPEVDCWISSRIRSIAFTTACAPRAGPTRQVVWGDLNSQPDVFRYAVTIINARTGQQCRADPGVVNDWD